MRFDEATIIPNSDGFNARDEGEAEWDSPPLPDAICLQVLIVVLSTQICFTPPIFNLESCTHGEDIVSVLEKTHCEYWSNRLMLVKDIMTHSIKAITANAKLPEAAESMRNLDVGFLPVIGGTELVGVVTDRDIAIRGVLPGRDCNEIPVSEVMTQGLETIPHDSLIDEAAAKMKEKQLRRLLVVDNDGTCIGVLSLGDLATNSDDYQMTGVALEKVCATT